MRNGELIWGDQRIPLDFAAYDTNVQLDYSFLRGRYESHLAVGKVDTAFEDFRPFAWMTTAEFSLGTTFADVKSLQWNSGRSRWRRAGASAISATPISMRATMRVSISEMRPRLRDGTIFAKALRNSRAAGGGR